MRGRGVISSDGLESAATTTTMRVESASRAIVERGVHADRPINPLKNMEDASKSRLSMDRGRRVWDGKKLTTHRFPLVHDQHGEQRIRERAGGRFGREGRQACGGAEGDVCFHRGGGMGDCVAGGEGGHVGGGGT